MSFFRWLASLIQIVGFRNYQVLKFSGLLPERTAVQESFLSKEEYIEVDSNSRLREYIEEGKPRILVTYVGVGSRAGFLLPSADAGVRIVLGDYWWRVEGQHVFLFAFSCHSYEYIEAGHVRKFVSNALCYEGKVWLAVSQGAYWVWFVDRIGGIVRRHGALGQRIFEDVLLEYARAIKGVIGPKGESDSKYLVQLALIKQSQQLRVVQGGRV